MGPFFELPLTIIPVKADIVGQFRDSQPISIMSLSLRLIFLFVVAITAENAVAAEQATEQPIKRRATVGLPPGLPHANYKFRTTIGRPTAHPVPRVYVREQVVYGGPDLLFTPTPSDYIENLPGAPLLPGSSTLPGYYGRAYSYDYQGPYYGGPYVGYWWRLPYACGVYGYC